jgi:tetratricopeptide (TPR) repeat protein
LASGDWHELERAVERFERAWEEGSRPTLDDYLPAEETVRSAVVIELAHAELEYRLRAGEPARAEDYLQKYPELRDDQAAAVDLIATEYHLRTQQRAGLPIQEFLERFPEFAAKLRARLEPNGAPATTPPASLPADALLGDFRMVREIGRGGMGIVYEAVQLSLNRRVALKVLPFAATLDPRRLQRFKNEAQAAAYLHHPNIVPVYAVGCEGSAHYFAMQLIEGQTLAAFISGLQAAAGTATADGAEPADDQGEFELASAMASGRCAPAPSPCDATGPYTPHPNLAEAPTISAPATPARSASTGLSANGRAYFRTVAHLGVQAAEALERAHQLGVVHRDIKPANLLIDNVPLTTHPSPRLWITDFGLAQVRTDTRLTLTGDLVGTLRYMSPEQALAKREPLDHRTDVYSLGVTLYELLTLRPAFDGLDRQELLRQVAFDEPRRPRRWNKAIPWELETIVLKATAKSPAERYATAQEMADDLRRFLEDRPIKAQRPRLPQRLTKLARRHRAVLTTAVAVTVLALIGAMGILGASYQRLQEQQRQTQVQYQRAEAHFLKTLNAVDALLLEVGDKELASVPHLEPVRRRLLEKALAFFDEFLQERGDDPMLRFEAGMAYRRVSDIHRQLGQFRKAEVASDQAIDPLSQLSEEDPKRTAYRHELARAYHGRYRLRDTLGPAAGEQAVLRAVELLEQLVVEEPEQPEHRHYLAKSVAGNANLQRQQGRYREAEKEYRRACALLDELVTAHPEKLDFLKDQTGVYGDLASVLDEIGTLGEAEKVYERIAQSLDQALRNHPDDREVRELVGLSNLNRGQFYLRRGRIPKGKQVSTRANEVLVKLAADYPGYPSYRSHVAAAHGNKGHFALLEHDMDSARKDFQKDLEIARELVKEFQSVPQYHYHLAGALNNLGIWYEENKELEKARPLLEEALNEGRKALAADPKNVRHREWTGNHLMNLAITWKQLRVPVQQTTKVHEEAIEVFQKLVDELPFVPTHQHSLGGALANYASFLKDRGELDKSLSLAQRALQHQRKALEVNPDHPYYLDFLRKHLNLLAEIQSARNHPETEKIYRQLLELDKKLLTKLSNKGQAESQLGSTQNSLGNWLRTHGDLQESLRLLTDAIRHQKAALQIEPGRPSYRLSLHHHHENRGRTLEVLKRFREAEAEFREAIKIAGDLRKEFPKDPQLRYHFAMTSYHRSRVLPQGEDREKVLREIVAMWQPLVKDYPRAADYANGLALALHDLAVTYGNRKNSAEARDLVLQAIHHQRTAVELAPHQANFRKVLADHYRGLAAASIDLHDHAAATAAVEEAIKIDPADWYGYYRGGMIYTECADLAHSDDQLAPQDRQKAADAYMERLKVLFREAAGRNPNEAEPLFNLAWFLSMGPDPKFHNPARALELANKAVKLKPENGHCWGVLGAAYYRAGRGGEAVAALTKALHIQGDNGADYFLLAMTEWQLGQEEQARRRYRQAVEWMNARAPFDRRLTMLRNEARTLMNIDEGQTAAQRLAEDATRHLNRAAELARANRHHEAEQAYRDCIAERKKLVEDFSNHAQYRPPLADVHHKLGEWLRVLGRSDDAEKEFQQSMDVWRTLAKDFPQVINYQADLANALDARGIILKETGRLQEATKAYDEALPIIEKLVKDKPTEHGYRRVLSRCLDNYALVLKRSGQTEQAITAQRRATDLMEGLCTEAPKNRTYKHELSIRLLNLGASYYDHGQELGGKDRPQADKIDRQAIAVLNELLQVDPRNTGYRADLALVESNLGGLLTVAGKYKEAEEQDRAALKHYEELVKELPDIPDHRHQRARTSLGIGILLTRAGRPKEAEPFYRASVKDYEELVAKHPRAIEFLDGQAKAQVTLAGFLMDTKQQPEAERRWRAACKSYGELLARRDDAAEYRRNLAECYTKVAGVLHAVKRPEEGRQEQAKALPHFERLVKDFPKESGYKEMLARCHLGLGDLCSFAKKLPEAERAYLAGLDLMEKLVGDAVVARSPDHVTTGVSPMRLSTVYDSLVSLMALTRRPLEAEKVHRRALSFFDKLSKDDPCETEFQAQLARWHYRLGNFCKDAKRLPDAEKEYRTAISIFEGLIAEQDKEPAYHYNLAVASFYLGALLRESGRPKDAEEIYRKFVPGAEKLVAQSPEVADYQSMLGGALNDWAMLLLVRGEAAEAQHLLERAITHEKKAIVINPRVPTYQEYLHKHYGCLADALNKLRKPAEAEQAQRRKIAVLEGLVRDFKPNEPYRMELAATSHNLAHQLSSTGRAQQSVPDYESAVEQYRILAAHPNAPPEMHSKAGATLNDLAMRLMERKEHKKAEERLKEAVEHQQKALAAVPKNPTFRRFLLNHYANLADIARQRGDHERVARVAEEMCKAVPDWWFSYWRAADLLPACSALAARDQRLPEDARWALVQAYRKRWASLQQEAGKRDPDDLEARDHIAWFLSNYAESSLRDPRLAVELARKTVEKAPKNASYQQTLGVALCRIGKWSEAVQALNESVELTKGGQCHDWLFLAMAHWHCDNETEAKKWYALTAKWMKDNGDKQKNQAVAGEIRRNLAEVAALMEKGAKGKDQEPKNK